MGSTYRAAGVATTLALVLSLTACIPGDPGPPPAGARVDDGVVTLLVRVCRGEHVLSATVWPFSADSNPPSSWSSSGFTGTEADGAAEVVLDHRSWEQSEGGYSVDGSSFEVETDGGLFATVLGGEHGVPPEKLSGLAPGEFSTDGKTVTVAEYLALVDQGWPCARRR